MQTLSIESLSAAGSTEAFLSRFVGLGQTLRAEPWNRSALSRKKESAILNAFATVPQELWISSETGKPVARISASFPLVATLPARVGFFEVDVRHPRWKEHAAQLFCEAHKWLAGRGQFEVVGPMNFTTWFPYRLKTNVTTTEQKTWEPGNPPEYVTAFEDAGYTVAGKYVSLCHEDLKDIVEENRHIEESFRSAGFRVRAGDLSNPAEVAGIHSITLAAFERNPLFEPIPLEVFAEVYAEVSSKGSAPQFLGIVEDASGIALGYVYGFVDGQEVIAKTMAFLPAVQGKGLGLLLYEAVCDFGLKHGCTRCVAALMSEEIRSPRLDEKFTTTHPLAWVHEYALFGRNVRDFAQVVDSHLAGVEGCPSPKSKG